MLAASELWIDGVQERHTELMAHARGLGNDDWLARMLATASHGGGALPDWFGLSPVQFQMLMGLHFPGVSIAPPLPGHQLATERIDEFEQLRELLLKHRAGYSTSEIWMAGVVAAACMASDHLWQDLGLWSRTDLSALMHANFPRLAARNTRNMKWKKFLYKQLCAAEGIFVCRAPSCEICTDFTACFGPEE